MGAADEARDALLGQIAKMAASDVLDSATVLQLAEAYAWLVNPDQGHGPRLATDREKGAHVRGQQELPASVEGRRPSPGLDDR